jgi:hypothetical protein
MTRVDQGDEVGGAQLGAGRPGLVGLVDLAEAGHRGLRRKSGYQGGRR